MANEKFKKALYDEMYTEYECRVPEHETHVFSKRFERNMNKLIRQQRKPYYKMINTVGKRVACIVVGILLASSVTVASVDALRTAFQNFALHTFEKYSIIQTVEDDSAPETIEELYEITYDLSEYKVDYEFQDDFYRNVTYINGDAVVDFIQCTKESYDMMLNTEDAEITTVMIHDISALYYCDNHNYSNLIWDNGDYILMILSNLDKETTILIAESVQKVEK